MRTQSMSLALAIVLFCPFASAQWVQTSLGLPDSSRVRCFAVGGTNLFVGTAVHGVFRSTDGGSSWTPASFGLTSPSILSFALLGTVLFAGTEGGVFASTNEGTIWTQAGLSSRGVTGLVVKDTFLFAGTGSNLGDPAAFRSSDSGANWTTTGPIEPGLRGWVRCFAISGTYLFVGGAAGTVFSGPFFLLSTDNGTSWTRADSGLGPWFGRVYCAAIVGSNIFTGTTFGIYLSSNRGTTWTGTSWTVDTTWEPKYTVPALAVSGTYLFAGTDGGGVIVSADNGTNWTAANTGLTETEVTSLVISGTNLFAGTASGGVWRRPLSEMITSVPPAVQLPTPFVLEQNYPNPFNPSTTIRYALPQRAAVTLRIYNTLGQEVRSLVQGEQEAGYHEAVFDASNLSSGVYFYRLQAGEYVETKKLMILR